jgi:methionyl-tRNA synthetase
MRGHATRLVCGTDDHQTYVALRAAREGASAKAVVVENTAKIMRAFELANIRFDRFVQSSRAPRHKALAQELLCDLHATGALLERDVPTLYCARCAIYAVEGLGAGKCRHCGSRTYADSCEACGLPNFGADLEDARCSLCDGPVGHRSVRRLVFPLERFRPAVEAFLAKALIGHHLRTFVDTVLRSTLPEIPVTVPTSWGIDVPITGFRDQRISAWFEVAAALLATCEGNDTGTTQSRRIVQLFGIDNGFFYAIYYPALLSASGRRPQEPDALIMNHFYQINGAKFSSGRTNALWANDVLGNMPVDLVRFYLSLTRPEDGETAFSDEEFQEIVGREVRGAWGGWLSSLEQRVDARCGGLAPFPQGWTTTQRLFFTQLADWITLIEADLSWRSFSPRRAASAICELVHGAIRFAALMEADHHADTSVMTTAVAIELAAAKALAGTVYPIMPEFGARLWEALGFAGEPTWRELGTLLPGGQRVRGLGQALERPS